MTDNEFHKFVEENCMMCGSQRCDPYVIDWLEGCTIYQDYLKKKEQKKMSKGKYKFYTDGSNKIVAVSSYAGKTVRGVAKCDPRDSFNQEAGQDLAVARCAMKIADKRYARAQREYAKAQAAVEVANARLNKMASYVRDASVEVSDAQKRLDLITAAL